MFLVLSSTRTYIPRVGDSYEINIIKPRKQLRKSLNYKMNRNDDIDAEKLKELRRFIIDNYGERAFTSEDLLCIWGEKVISKDKIEYIQKLLIETVYFEQDNKRLFMFLPVNGHELNKKLQDKEPTQTEVHDLSLELKWNIEINEQTNFAAVDGLIKELIGYELVSKISHHIGENKIIVKLNGEKDISDIQEEFYKKTGFKDELFKPYKKSIIRIGFMKLTFISPEAGNININKINELARISGWNIEVTDSYNQNEILNIAENICRKLDIHLKKRPSFNPQLKCVKIQSTTEISEVVLKKLDEMLYLKTAIKNKH
ncbi:hypothetical protein [Clostridium sp. ZS2-4]|uniref:hypothetical protein n=1 Tax=Clostridium sp. ZS2-4 TaxID=2987703 RepID=UPI00227BA949|nr:hypothetical protein [Clostridium sp. ZS2-4]MCY6354659.1 hypothetical protein [Clostridium sp. ZS2-4]